MKIFKNDYLFGSEVDKRIAFLEKNYIKKNCFILCMLISLLFFIPGCENTNPIQKDGDEKEQTTSPKEDTDQSIPDEEQPDGGNVGDENGDIDDENDDVDDENDDVDDDNFELVDITYMEDYSLLGTTCGWSNRIKYGNGVYQNIMTLINSEQEIEQHLGCWNDNYPPVDFSKHSLLVATGVSRYIISDISKNLIKQSNGYALNVDITALKKANHRHYWEIALITNKLSKKSNIELNVTTTYDEKEHEIFELEMGTYVEPYPVTSPVMGYTKIEFIDKERLVLTKYVDAWYCDEIRDEYKYKIHNYWLILNPYTDSSFIYFRTLNHRKFEIGYLYPYIIDVLSIPPIMTFEKK